MNKAPKVLPHLLKNCDNCKHLEWIEAEEHDPIGFICQKKPDDEKLIDRLEAVDYRFTSKKCFEPKALYYVGYREIFEKQNRHGYTTDISKAGRFTLDQAFSMTRDSENEVRMRTEDHCRWFIPCSAIDSFKDGKFHPRQTY